MRNAESIEELFNEISLELLDGYNKHIQENFEPSKRILSTKEWFEKFKKDKGLCK